MGVELPNPGNVFIPEVPESIKEQSPELFNWAQSVRKELTKAVQDMFSNDLLVATTINLGVSGTFAIVTGKLLE